LLVDAAQLVAHRKVNMERWGIDYLAFSAHKVYAPFGSGALVVKKGLLRYSSAEMELIRSSGEENAGGIAALGKVLLLLQRIGMDVIQEEEQAMTVRVVKGLAQIEGVEMIGISDTASPKFTERGAVIAFSLKDKVSSGIGNELAMQGGIGIRFGCHCAHILVKHMLGVGPKLEQFQRMIVKVFPRLQLPGVLRVSLGIGNNEEEIDTFIRVFGEIAKKEKGTKSDREKVIYQKPGLNKTEVKKQMKEFVNAAAEKVYSVI